MPRTALRRPRNDKLRNVHQAKVPSNLYECSDGTFRQRKSIIFSVGRRLAPAVPFDLHKITVNKINMRFIPHKEHENLMQNGGSKTAPYGFSVVYRICTAQTLSLQGCKHRRQSLPAVLQVGASVICLTSTPSPRHHYDAEIKKSEIKKPSTQRRAISHVRIATDGIMPSSQ